MIDTKALSPEELAELKVRVKAAQQLLAEYDPIGEAMNVLEAAGCYKCKISGTTPTGMVFKMSSDGTPPPKAKRATASKKR